MSFFSTELKNLHDLFCQEIKDLYDAEIRIVDALPEMAKAACQPELKEAFNEHLEQSKLHVKRLEQVFGLMNAEPERVTCDAMKGLLSEGEEMIDTKGDDATRDAGLIAAAQKVEHYEIASYGSCRTFAERLGLHDAARILQETLDEEKETDKKLTQIAESSVNFMARH